MHNTKKLIYPLVPQLLETIQYVYQPAGLSITTPPEPEKEGAEYAASQLGINHQQALFRIAKKTPKKIGQFVTVWKRLNHKSPIMPFDTSDQIHWLIVHVHDHNHQGQFIFPHTILEDKQIIAKQGKGGKRAFRIYPPWEQPSNPTAINTQAWQQQYFLPIGPQYTVDFQKVQDMFLNCNNHQSR